jgi:hypothetical protein
MMRMMSKENVIILAQMVQMVLEDMVQVQVEVEMLLEEKIMSQQMVREKTVAVNI